MTLQQKLKRIDIYIKFLKVEDNLKLFQKVYSIPLDNMLLYIRDIKLTLNTDVHLTRNNKVFLNELERTYQRTKEHKK